MQGSPPAPTAQHFARTEATNQQAQTALQNPLGSSAGLSGPVSHPTRPDRSNESNPSAANTPLAVPRASFPQPQIHNVNNGPHVPTTQQPAVDPATTAAASDPQLQAWQAPQQMRAPQAQTSVPPTLPGSTAASVAASRPGKPLLRTSPRPYCRDYAQISGLIFFLCISEALTILAGNK